MSNMLCFTPVKYEVLALTALSLENASLFLLLPSLLCSQPQSPWTFTCSHCPSTWSWSKDVTKKCQKMKIEKQPFLRTQYYKNK